MLSQFFFQIFTFLAAGTGEFIEEMPGVQQDTRTVIQHYQFNDIPTILSDSTFEKIGQDVRCGDEALIPRVTVSTMSQCKASCVEHTNCRYFAFWQKKKLCEIYAYCASQEPDNGHSISLYERLSLCQSELSKSGMSNPFTAMVGNFLPLGTVRFEGPRRNMHCYCATSIWMVCSIIVNPESTEERIVRERLDRSRSEEALRPFYSIPSKLLDPEDYTICYDIFVDVPRNLRIWNEIQVVKSTNCIRINSCLQGTPSGICPITKQPFQPGEAVFILKEDVPNASLGIPIPCYSFLGMRTIMANHIVEEQGYFHDQLMREGVRPMRESDYALYAIVSDAQASEGLCQVPATHVMGPVPEERTHIFQPNLLVASQSLQGPSTGGKRKSKKKKKASAAGAASSSRGVSPGAPSSSSGVSPAEPSSSKGVSPEADPSSISRPQSRVEETEKTERRSPTTEVQSEIPKSTMGNEPLESQQEEGDEDIDWKSIIWTEKFPDPEGGPRRGAISPHSDPWPGHKYVEMFPVSPDFPGVLYPIMDHSVPQSPFACSPTPSEAHSVPEDVPPDDPCLIHSRTQSPAQSQGRSHPSSRSDDDLTLQENVVEVEKLSVTSPQAEQPSVPNRAERLPPKKTPSSLNAPEIRDSPPARPASPILPLNPNAPEFTPQSQSEIVPHGPQSQRGRPSRSLRGRRTQRSGESSSPQPLAASPSNVAGPSSLIGCTVELQQCNVWAALDGRMGIVEAETESDVIVKIVGHENVRVSRDCILFIAPPEEYLGKSPISTKSISWIFPLLLTISLLLYHGIRTRTSVNVEFHTELLDI